MHRTPDHLEAWVEDVVGGSKIGETVLLVVVGLEVDKENSHSLLPQFSGYAALRSASLRLLPLRYNWCFHLHLHRLPILTLRMPCRAQISLLRTTGSGRGARTSAFASTTGFTMLVVVTYL